MKRRGVVLVLSALLVLGLPTAPAHAAPEAGTVELQGLITYTTSGGSSTVYFYPTLCAHAWTAGANTCRYFLLGDTTATGSFFTLTGTWNNWASTYSMSISMPDLIMVAGPHVGVGTVTSGGRSGPATLTMVDYPHPDTTKAVFAATLEYVLTS